MPICECFTSGISTVFSGRSAEWSVRLEVTPSNATVFNVNEAVQFKCTVIGYSNYSMEWVKMVNAYVYTRVSGTRNANSSISVLTVRGAGEGGQYRCIVTKAAGDEMFRDVYVYGCYCQLILRYHNL